MAETTNKRGRKPNTEKATTENTITEKTTENNDSMMTMLAEMQKQMEALKQELADTKKAKDEAVGQNLDLQTLVDALKSTNNANGTEGSLPNYVTVISLVPNVFNISTQADGRGTLFSFAELGESKVISLANVRDIMSVSKYRQQAEEGFFYILEDEVNQYFRLDKVSNTAQDIKEIVGLVSDECVNKFVALDAKLQESIADKIAKDIAEGKKIDKNRTSEILEKTGIDIDERARQLKKILSKR